MRCARSARCAGQVAEVATQKEALAERIADAEARLGALFEDKHAMVLRLKQVRRGVGWPGQNGFGQCVWAAWGWVGM